MGFKIRMKIDDGEEKKYILQTVKEETETDTEGNDDDGTDNQNAD